MHKLKMAEMSKAHLLVPLESVSAGANQTQWFDQLDNERYEEMEFLIVAGAVTGSPSAHSIVVHVETSPDKSAVSDISGATVTIDGDNELHRIHIKPGLAERYIRVDYTAAFTGGSSPDQPLAVAMIGHNPIDVPVDGDALTTEA